MVLFGGRCLIGSPAVRFEASPPPRFPLYACLVFGTGCASWRVFPLPQLEIGRLLRLIGLPERVTRFRSAAVYPKPCGGKNRKTRPQLC